MRRTLKCPKCEGRKLWHVPIVRVTGTEVLFTFELFTCDQCGYTEWYAKKPAEMPEGEAIRARFLDNEPPGEGGGPYR
jgi:predicted nucleic-acid-binding Zn-ribbon protein